MTQESGMGKILILFVAVVTVAAIVSFTFYKTETRAEASHEPILEPVQGWIGTTVGAEMPGYMIIDQVAVAWSTINVTADMNVSTSINKLTEKHSQHWEANQANALINMRITNATSEYQGSKWNTATIIVYGDLVKLAKVKK